MVCISRASLGHAVALLYISDSTTSSVSFRRAFSVRVVYHAMSSCLRVFSLSLVLDGRPSRPRWTSRQSRVLCGYQKGGSQRAQAGRVPTTHITRTSAGETLGVRRLIVHVNSASAHIYSVVCMDALTVSFPFDFLIFRTYPFIQFIC